MSAKRREVGFWPTAGGGGGVDDAGVARAFQLATETAPSNRRCSSRSARADRRLGVSRGLRVTSSVPVGRIDAQGAFGAKIGGRDQLAMSLCWSMVAGAGFQFALGPDLQRILNRSATGRN